MSWVYTWISDALWYLGLKNRQKTILLLGLDNAGKTTVLHFLVVVCRSREELGLEGVRFLKFDLGGLPYPGHRWYEHAQDINGIVFMVDASDRERMEDAALELRNVLTNDKVAIVPIVVLANKIDRPDALSDDELVRALNVLQLRTGKGSGFPKRRPFEVFMCTVMKRQGYSEGLAWLAHNI